MNFIFKKLKESYPDSSSLSSFFWGSLGVGGFIFLFLFLFQPFGIATVPKNTFGVCAGFGLITFAISLLFELFIRFVLKIDKEVPSWTLGKWIISTSILISLIAVANHLYLMWLYPEGPFQVENLIYSFIATFSVGIFPVIFAGLFNQLRYLKRNLKQAQEIQVRDGLELLEHTALLELPSANKKQNIQMSLQELLFIEAMQNYVLVYAFKEGELEKQIIRNTISQLENSLPEIHFYRCHRSYLVNLNQIHEVEGNAQGLKLFFRQTADLSIPVSRNKIKELKNHLSQKGAVRP